MNATRLMVSVWNGSRGIILGGANNSTAVNEVLAYDPVNNFLPGSPYANLTIAAKQGYEYVVELNATDEFGYSYPASARFSVDRLAPELSCPVRFYSNASLTPACSIWDNTSGISRVVVGLLPDNGAANYTMSDDYLGAKSVALNLSLPFGPNLTVVVNITDKAGNYRNESRRVIFDDTPPDITAILAGIQNNIIRVNKLDSIANAWDNASGLASVEVYLRNRAGDSWLVNSTTLNASTLSLTDTTIPWHTSLLNFSHIYTVDVRAVDNAGNVNDTRSNSTRLTLGAVLTPPKGTANMPSRLNTSFFGRLPLLFNASVANGRFALDEVTLRLWNGSTTLINQSWNNTTATTFNQIWNSTATPWTTYNVSFTARSSTDTNTTNLIVWRPSDPRTTTAANVSNLSAYENFANLTNSSDYNVYRVSYSIKCVGVWSVTVASLDGEDVDLYMTPDPDPISDASTNTADYAFSDTTTSSTATLTFAGTGGNDYMVLIKKKGPNATDYQLIYDASCNAKDTRDPPSQSETLGNPTVSWNGP